TLVVLMGLGSLTDLSALLRRRGWRPATPAAICRAAGTPGADTWIGTLEGLAAAPARGDAPGTVVIGDVGTVGAALAAALCPPTARRGREPGGVEEDSMAVRDDPRTLGRTRLSFADQAEVDDFVTTLERFERGELPPDQWRSYRLVRGTYGQRQAGDAQMLRVKVPQGILDAAHLDALADVAEAYSRGFAHITTRQNFQLHFLRLPDVEHTVRRLAAAGLTTREACGNSVRN